MSKWKKIDSAPKDGTVFLGWSDRELFPAAMRRGRAAFWERIVEDGGPHSGENSAVWVYADVSLHNEVGSVSPSHWMPMPAPPKP